VLLYLVLLLIRVDGGPSGELDGASDGSGAFKIGVFDRKSSMFHTKDITEATRVNMAKIIISQKNPNVSIMWPASGLIPARAKLISEDITA